MSKTAVQKDRLPFQFEGAATSYGGGGLPPKPKPSYVPADLGAMTLARWNPGFPLQADCDVYVGGKVRVLELMRFFYLKHSGSKINFVL